MVYTITPPFAFYMGNDLLFHIADTEDTNQYALACGTIIYCSDPSFAIDSDLLCPLCADRYANEIKT